MSRIGFNLYTVLYFVITFTLLMHRHVSSLEDKFDADSSSSICAAYEDALKDVSRNKFYRYYSGEYKDHFYTTDYSELGSGRSSYKLEGNAGYLWSKQVNGITKELYRYNARHCGDGKDHFYTANYNELGSGNSIYKQETTPGYIMSVDCSNYNNLNRPLYRYYAKLPTCDHFYTTNYNELKSGNSVYKYEGIAGYVATSDTPYPTSQPTDKPTPSPTWVTPCLNDPCDCSADDLCKICDSNGCSQCEDVGTNFKLDYNYPCVNCQSIFGDGCKFCQDFIGCGQCETGYTREYDEQEDLYYCVKNANNNDLNDILDVIVQGEGEGVGVGESAGARTIVMAFIGGILLSCLLFFIYKKISTCCANNNNKNIFKNNNEYQSLL